MVSTINNDYYTITVVVLSLTFVILSAIIFHLYLERKESKKGENK